MQELSPRERSILDGLVNSYIQSGEPVGSRTLSKAGLGLSPATVRNSMADLEDKGYLFQPHTSAGRVPTDKGYRFFVDTLLSQEGLDDEGHERLRGMVDEAVREHTVESLIGQVSKVMADVSRNLGVALSPQFREGKFRSIEMVRLSESKLLLVLTIHSGLVKTMVVEVEGDVDDDALDATRRVINERLADLTIGEILSSVQERLTAASSGSPKLLRLICESAPSLFQYTTEDDLHLVGTGNFFTQPEFSSDQSSVARLHDLFEERTQMAGILGERVNADGITITIGSENPSPDLQNCSLMTSRYRLGNISGIIGIIGPTRMPYSQMVPVIRHLAVVTESMLEEWFGER